MPQQVCPYMRIRSYSGPGPYNRDCINPSCINASLIISPKIIKKMLQNSCLPAIVFPATGKQVAGGSGKSLETPIGQTPFAKKTMKMKNKASSVNASALIAVGSAGTALCLTPPPESFPIDGTPTKATFRGFKATGISPVEIGELHGRGEACGLPEFDAALFVSPRGETVRVMPLADALKRGVVSEVKVCLSRDGVKREATVYAPKGWTTGHKVPQFLASPDVKARRIERHAINDGRNASYTGKVLPLTFLGTKAPEPKQPAIPAKTPAPAVKPAKTPPAQTPPAGKTPKQTPKKK